MLHSFHTHVLTTNTSKLATLAKKLNGSGKYPIIGVLLELNTEIRLEFVCKNSLLFGLRRYTLYQMSAKSGNSNSTLRICFHFNQEYIFCEIKAILQNSVIALQLLISFTLLI